MEGSTWSGYFQAQQSDWFLQGMYWRNVFGYVTAAGIVLLFWDMLTIGAREERSIKQVVGDAADLGHAPA